MHFKERIIKGRKYKYAVQSIRLPGGKVKTLEKIFKGESKKELEKIFEEKKKREYVKHALKNFKTDYIFTKEQFEKIEEIKLNYSKILKELPKASFRDLLDRFTANFTYESNALEGNSLTLKDVAIIMFENASIKGKDLREIYETRNSREVLALIIKNKFKVTQEDTIKMHKMLVKDIDIQTGYKKFPNIIVGKKIKTTPPEKVEEEIGKLVKWYQENKNKVHPIKLAALFHGKFEKIHPFEDGNGRVGRFLINIILINNKYPPLIIRKSQRLAYITALEKFDDKYYDALERFILKRFKETYKKFFEVYVRYI
ncbi:Fic family protein [Candidatus Pacearchaeota archaeon]|nr:Fic family protein [Candidatus Pacearchaeota archaeon]